MSASENNSGSPPLAQEALDSLHVPTSPQARAKRQIATLMEEVELLKQDKVTKQRKATYYVSQGRAIHSISPESTMEQDRIQRGYIELAKALPWIHDKLASLDHEESEDMLKKIRRGADSARGDDTGTLKELVALWLNIEFCPTPFISAGDKHRRGFSSVRAGIQDRTTAFIVSKNSWPLFMYQNSVADPANLECGLMRSKLLVMGFKAIFTSPSSANEVDGDGEGADIIENNRHARRQSDQTKVKTCVASIIGMRKVTPRAIAYAACQIRFALSSITSWRTIDGDFDYQMFWNNIVDFFEDPPGPAARGRVNDTLKWWTRKVFGTNHRQDLTSEVVSRMSVSALASQRLAMEDAVFDSDS
ncbi:uncharacterized protein HD556DRAFT_1447180 [Suillus plorans]|uniref:Uncharacterized protein n=1 Tax=Suillus plorans TaxID=116603 RepID=A0A9P7AGK6_9AGAM|nr:uncharacterized protein HD556DRAFT_1447180 [Suillus plorans]KAG1789117.1 hypothetical protein HD556DRAFT_1447180 [Suillus plorans]